MSKVRTSSANFLRGHTVAVVSGLPGCEGAQPKEKGAARFSIRKKPESGSKVLAYATEIWLEQVSFFVRPLSFDRRQKNGTHSARRFVVGKVIAKRSAKVTQRNGWSSVRLDTFDQGCFYRASTGASVRRARYVRIHHRTIQAFGLRDGEPVSTMHELEERKENPQLPVYGPRRDTWRGDLGGLNFEIASPAQTGAAVHWVLERHPNCVIVDGTDDWNAPRYARPQLLCRKYELQPIAWWHTGMSGQGCSGVVLDGPTWDAFRRAYQADCGFPPECCPGPPPRLGPAGCGCWEGEGLRVYRF